MSGHEPLSTQGGPIGVLVLHGFTGSPFSMRSLAERMVDAGFGVEMPLLPGHGTSLEDMIPTRFADWTAEAERAYQRLAARSEQLFVIGLSMGGTLSCWLAVKHPEIAGLALINPLVQPFGEEQSSALQGLLDSGVETVDFEGSDIAKPGVEKASYDGMPVAPMLSLFAGVEALAPELESIHCPVLLFSSAEDHVIPTSNGPYLMEQVGGPIEQIPLERSYHVATLDFDAGLIEVESVAFVERIAGSRP
jgi:carboxylesterase